ncbi:ABC transporter ATP-binding protein [Streptomyces inhibens]|uniref:ABC transporter ATP-binding protein n=1 Tax=Streptomyces inhibens TaxID=2293571 RepID=A0A371PSI3_STRIH|nr:ABC transporter ATP-binding protein [Streptomyces inhibens]
MIEVTGLRRRYGGAGRSAKSRTRRGGQRPESPPAGRKSFEAVRGVDFSVELLEGLAAPTSGRIGVLGHDPFRERRKVRPRIGVMLQEGGFPSELTPEETLRMWAGCTSGARPVEAALGAVGLERRKGVRVKQLSGGERRRLDLALALLGRPEVLFLDEPTTGLDAEARHETWELVRELRDSGTTIVLTTHYLEEAEELADRLAILHNGRIAAAGPLADVVAARPSHLSFGLPDGFHIGDLPPLGELGVVGHETEGRTVRLRTDELQRATTGVLLWARDKGLELRGLDVRSASPEEAFLQIAKGLENA